MNTSITSSSSSLSLHPPSHHLVHRDPKTTTKTTTTATATCSHHSNANSTRGNMEEVSPSPPPPPPPERLRRLGSGASVVLDPPEPGGETESRKLPPSKYKGVVPQPNRRWGAQIYEKHQRVWLGTFNNKAEAARAYDVAAQRFRGGDAVTNFKPLSESDDADATVLVFLNSHSKAEIVDMLRKHTYHNELHQSRHSSAATLCKLKGEGINRYPLHGFTSGSKREHLFDKVVTPSDVGKLNRLVIPKQHAEKHLTRQVGRSNAVAACKEQLLNFEDSTKKVWRFRYSYWNSSQSYVLTKGWSRFVKEKGLRAGDIVTFQRSTGPDRTLYIDWKPRSAVAGAGGGAVTSTTAACGCYRRSVFQVPTVKPVQVVRLFGVNIVKRTSTTMTGGGGGGVVVGGGWNDSGKRRRELELLPSHYFSKKQFIGPS